MSKVENETKNLTLQDKDIKSSQPKTNKKVAKKEGEVEPEQPKQDKKKSKQEKKKANHSDPENAASTAVNTDKTVSKTESKDKKKEGAKQKPSLSINEDSVKIKTNDSSKKPIVDSKKEGKKSNSSDVKKQISVDSQSKSTAPPSLEKKQVLEAVDSVKAEMPAPKKSRKSKTSTSSEHLSSKSDTKTPSSSASSREESSNIIINYFQQICEDLRAIRNYLVPISSAINKEQSKPEKKLKAAEETIEVVKPAKKTKRNIEDPAEVSTIKKVESDKKVQGEPMEVTNDDSKVSIVVDDEFLMAKLRGKIEKDEEFTAKNASKVWLTQIGRYSIEKWTHILDNLCQKKLIIAVDTTGDRIKYKFAE